MRNPAGAGAVLKAAVPALVIMIVLLFCSWRVHQDNRRKQPDRVDILVYSPDGTIITPVLHR